MVHPGAGNETGTLVNALIAHCGDSLSGIGGVKRPGIVHRLDKDTSGLAGRGQERRGPPGPGRAFAAHGRDGRLERGYLAIVWGVPERTQRHDSASIGRSTSNRQKMAVSRARPAPRGHHPLRGAGALRATARGQPAAAASWKPAAPTRSACIMAHIGHPLLGDPVYGAGFRVPRLSTL